jgi:phage gp29-like protein
LGIFASLSSWFARAAGRSKMTTQVALVDELPLWLNPGRIGGELTPKRVSEIFAYADQGYLYQLIDLFDEARQKDCHLHAVLSTFELALALLEVQVIPASTKRKDLKIAAWVESWLRDFGARVESDRAYDLSTLIAHLAGGYGYGHAVAEPLWEKRGLELVPIGAEPLMPRRFCFAQDTSELNFWDSNGGQPYPGTNLLQAYPDRFIQFRPRVTGAGPAREGLLRPLTWAALFRNWTVKDWLSLAELAWKPWRIGKYKKDEFASAKDIAALENALQYLVTNGATLLPDTVDLKVEFAKATGSSGSSDTGPHGALAAFLAAEMSKAVLGQTMTTEDGSSLSQAKVHRQVQNDRRNAAARAIAAILQRQLVAVAVRLNFGADAAVPSIHLAGGEDVDLARLAQAIEKLVSCGLPVSIPWIYKLYGMPTPKAGEQVIGPSVPEIVPSNAERAKIARIRIAEQRTRVELPPARVRMLEGDDLDDHLDAEVEARAIEEAQRRHERRRALA